MHGRRDSVGPNGPEKEGDRWHTSGSAAVDARQTGTGWVMIPSRRLAIRYEENEG